jgi:hypothetical protein
MFHPRSPVALSPVLEKLETVYDVVVGRARDNTRNKGDRLVLFWHIGRVPAQSDDRTWKRFPETRLQWSVLCCACRVSVVGCHM